MSKTRAIAHQALAYVVATAIALGAGYLSATAFPGWHLLIHVLIADLVGTVVVFGFSRFHDNSSLYDPYWSVAPIVIALTYLGLSYEAAAGPGLVEFAAVALVTLWGVRLTYNFFVGWSGMNHEDWRYRDFRQQFPRAYWWVSFGGVHTFPTLLVYAGCFGLWAVFFGTGEAIPWLELTGGLVMLAAVIIEAVSDAQLRRFVSSKPEPGTIMEQGLWRYSRHPNYFGELSFWWGLWIMGAGASPDTWHWTLAGPVAMTLLFVFVSVPLLDKRSLRRREGYAEHMKRVSGIVPLPRRAGPQADS